MIAPIGSVSPAANLVDHTLPDGWVVVEKVSSAHGNAGGYTHTYRVDGGTRSKPRAFLKVHDFASAWDDPDYTRVLAPMFQAYDFEKDVLGACRGLSHVVRILGWGAYHIAGTPATDKVSYIILELADGDVRKFLDDPPTATHRVHKHPTGARVGVVDHGSGTVKPVYIKMAIKAIDQVRGEQ